MGDILLASVSFVAGGAAGWIAHTLIRDPINEFIKIRKDGFTALLACRDVLPLPEGTGSPHQRQAVREEMAVAKRTLRLSSESLVSFAASYFFITRALSHVGYDVQRAGEALGNFGEHIDQPNTDREFYFREYKQALRFKGQPRRTKNSW